MAQPHEHPAAEQADRSQPELPAVGARAWCDALATLVGDAAVGLVDQQLRLRVEVASVAPPRAQPHGIAQLSVAELLGAHHAELVREELRAALAGQHRHLHQPDADPSEAAWSLDAAPLRDAGGQVVAGVALLRGSRVLQRLMLLRRARELLDGPTDEDLLLDRVAQLVVPGLGDGCVVHLLRQGEIRLAAARHVDPAKQALLEQLWQAHRPPPLISEPIAAGRPVRLPELPAGMLRQLAADPATRELLGRLGLGPILFLPLAAQGQVIGMLSLCRARGAPAFDDHDLEVAEEVAGRVTLALRDARARYELNTAVASLQHQALHDQLTGLPNRALFLDRVDHALSRLHRSREPLAVLFLDMDRFKAVNDAFGHDIGDQLLLVVAGRLRHTVRPADTVARLHGDEFTVLCQDVGDTDHACQIAARICEAVSTPVTLASSQLIPNVSIGVAVAEAPDVSAMDLLRRADTAMYQAKEQGRSGWAIYDAHLHATSTSRLELAGALRQVTARDELHLYFQPVVRLEDTTTASVEALLRWAHPTRGLLGPDEFIPVAEETGLIVELGRWVLQHAVEQARAWQARAWQAPQRRGMRVSVNISPQQLWRPSFRHEVAEALAAAGIDPSTLVLELTEGTLMLDLDAATTKLHALKDLGVRLAIDDFGTGYSSLSYLHRFPVDELKIDRSFLDPGDHSEPWSFIEAIITLGHTLGLELVAEGIEREPQRRRLQALGCELGQGFLFAPPQPADRLTPMLDRLPATGGGGLGALGDGGDAEQPAARVQDRREGQDDLDVRP